MLMKKLLGVCLTLFVVDAFLAEPARAVPMLDQEFAPTLPNSAGVFSDANSPFPGSLDRSQVFTVGVTGLLTSIEVQIYRQDNTVLDPVLFDVRTTTSGVPTTSNTGSNVLASGSLAASLVPIANFSTPPDFTIITLGGGGISVTAGDQLAIALRSETPNSMPYLWFGEPTDDYSGGAAYRRSDGPFWFQDFIADHTFRTFVDAGDPGPGTLPEPATIALLGLGLVGLGFAARLGRGHSAST